MKTDDEFAIGQRVYWDKDAWPLNSTTRGCANARRGVFFGIATRIAKRTDTHVDVAIADSKEFLIDTVSARIVFAGIPCTSDQATMRLSGCPQAGERLWAGDCVYFGDDGLVYRWPRVRERDDTITLANLRQRCLEMARDEGLTGKGMVTRASELAAFIIDGKLPADTT